MGAVATAATITVHGGADDGRLVPGRDQDGGTREPGPAPVVVVVPEMNPDQQVLIAGGEQRDGSEQHEEDEQPAEHGEEH
jgi:hypothetical protein